jgi:hypothetical protein
MSPDPIAIGGPEPPRPARLKEANSLPQKYQQKRHGGAENR